MEAVLLTLGWGGSLGVLAGAFALGLRHGIDWDHIAAITDITSTTTAGHHPDETWLIQEPGVLLTDESDHVASELARRRPVAGGGTAVAPPAAGGRAPASPRWVDQRRAMFL